MQYPSWSGLKQQLPNSLEQLLLITRNFLQDYFQNSNVIRIIEKKCVTMCYISLIILQGQTHSKLIQGGFQKQIYYFLISSYREESLPLGFMLGGLQILSPRGHQVLLKKSLNNNKKKYSGKEQPKLSEFCVLMVCSLFKSC